MGNQGPGREAPRKHSNTKVTAVGIRPSHLRPNQAKEAGSAAVQTVTGSGFGCSHEEAHGGWGQQFHISLELLPACVSARVPDRRMPRVKRHPP